MARFFNLHHYTHTINYSVSKDKATYKKRGILLKYNINGEINPKISNLKRNHVNSSGKIIKKLSSWNSESSLIEAGWNVYCNQFNTTSVSYALNNSNKLEVAFIVGGSDYINPYRTITYHLPLKIK